MGVYVRTHTHAYVCTKGMHVLSMRCGDPRRGTVRVSDKVALGECVEVVQDGHHALDRQRRPQQNVFDSCARSGWLNTYVRTLRVSVCPCARGQDTIIAPPSHDITLKTHLERGIYCEACQSHIAHGVTYVRTFIRTCARKLASTHCENVKWQSLHAACMSSGIELSTLARRFGFDGAYHANRQHECHCRLCRERDGQNRACVVSVCD